MFRSERKAPLRRGLFVLAAFVLLSASWFYKELFLGYLFCFGDLTYYFYPYRYFMAQAVRHGVLPLWNPFIQMGFPFLATLQTGFYYPLSVIYYLFPFDQAFNWFLIAHYPLGAFFMYLLGRELKQSVPAAASAGLVFAFSGYLSSVLHMPTTLAAVVWLPLIFLFFRRSLEPVNKTRNLAATGVFLALMLLGGEPTVFYGTIGCLLVYLAYRRQPAGIIGLAAALVLAAGLTAVQLLPFAELLFHSVRGAGLSYEEAVKYSVPLHKLAGLFWPSAGRSPWLESGWLKNLYLGFVPLLLALFALRSLPVRQRWWLGGALLLILLITAGAYSPLPVYRFLYAFVPGFNLFRYPAKFMFLFVFIFAYLSGRGLDLLAERVPARAGLVGAGLLALVLAELYIFNSAANFSVAANRYHAVPQNVRLLAADRAESRYFIAPDALNKCRYEDSREFSDWGRALLSLRNRLTYDQNMIFGLAALDGYESVRGADQQRVLKKINSLDSLDGVRALDLFNMKYLVTAAPFAQAGYRLLTVIPEEFKGGKIYLYENLNVLPRSFYVPAARVVADRSEILDSIFRPGFDPRRELLLEEKVAAPSGFWFTSEWFYPGWKAFVDGKEAKVYRADYLFRAVALPRPDSQVTWVYDPASFKLGALITLLSLAVTGVLLLRRR